MNEACACVAWQRPMVVDACCLTANFRRSILSALSRSELRSTEDTREGEVREDGRRDTVCCGGWGGGVRAPQAAEACGQNTTRRGGEPAGETGSGGSAELRREQRQARRGGERGERQECSNT